MTDYTDVAVDLYPNGKKVSEVVFDTLKRVMGGVDDGKYGQFSKINQVGMPFLSIDPQDGCFLIRHGDLAEIESFNLKTPTEILGQPLMDAIEQGFTPILEGAQFPANTIPYFDGYAIIAYKKADPKADINSEILSEKVGTKYDQGKPAYNLIPVHAEAELVDVLTFGASKYGPENWRNVEPLQSRYLAAALRHIAAYRMGETNDIESGKHHLAHAMCCMAFITEADLAEGK